MREGKMPSDKVKRILKSKTDFTDEQIDSLSESAAWSAVYKIRPRKMPKDPVKDEICFTGFSPSEKQVLCELAHKKGLKVVKSVTKNLSFLCAGENAGPSKCKKAQEKGVKIITRDELKTVSF
jgi:NAD-dependent DNA ligase